VPLVEACAATGAVASVGAPIKDEEGHAFIAILRVDGGSLRGDLRAPRVAEIDAELADLTDRLPTATRRINNCVNETTIQALTPDRMAAEHAHWREDRHTARLVGRQAAAFREQAQRSRHHQPAAPYVRPPDPGPRRRQVTGSVASQRRPGPIPRDFRGDASHLRKDGSISPSGRTGMPMVIFPVMPTAERCPPNPDNGAYARHFGRKADAQAWIDEQTAKLVAGTHIAPRQTRTTVGE